MQIFPSAAASQGPAVDKRAQPLGPEECVNAANDYGRQSTDSAGAGPHSRGEFIIIKLARPERVNNFRLNAQINLHGTR